MSNKPPTKSQGITLDFDGAVITPDTFRRVVSAFVDLLTAVTDKAAGDGKKPVWNMSVESGSCVFVAKPVPDAATGRSSENVMRAIKEGIHRLEKGAIAPPSYFDQKALRAVRELASLSDNKRLKYIRFKTGSGAPVTMTKSAVDTAIKLLGQHQALGSVEGNLQTISVRGTPQFVVFDSLYHKGVNCFMGEGVLEDAMRAFQKRVVVTGMVQYDKDSRPVSIKVDSICVFKDISQLPPMKELRGILKRAT